MSDSEKFSISVKSPMGTQESDLFLTSDGDQLIGKMVSPDGEINIDEGKIDGDQLSWTAKVDKPVAVTLSFSGTRNGDSIEGEVKFGMFGKGPFSAIKT
jgi:hypothetical protein